MDDNNDGQDQNSSCLFQQDDGDDEFLTLSLSFRPLKPTHSSSNSPPKPKPLSSSPPPPQFPQPSSPPLIIPPPHLPECSPSPPSLPPSILPRPHRPSISSTTRPEALSTASSSTRPILRVRRTRPTQEYSETVPPPYPWATTKRATVHPLDYLVSNKILTIRGEVQCKRCKKRYEIGYDLKKRFYEVGSFIAANKYSMHDRAPTNWMNPTFPACKFCNQDNSAEPVIAEKKKCINWLFLLLGETLGCCTLRQLRYFCKHTNNHRTGAKDRLLYLIYLGLCKQLDPTGPFNV